METTFEYNGKRISLRKKIKSKRYGGEEYNCDEVEHHPYLPDSRVIKIEDERFTWDFFYTHDKASDLPFSGFNTFETVQMILTALNKLRRKRRHNLIHPDDVILEVGHGKFPLIWDLRAEFKDFMYFGIEFSSIAFQEAVRQRFNDLYTPDQVIGNKAEFLYTKSLHYFNPDGSNNLDLVYPTNPGESILKPGTVTLALGKSFLDYLSCRLTLSVSVSNWSLEPRIPQGVVDMFDSISIALKDTEEGGKQHPLFILVEPDDPVKFKDHVGIIAKVIYTSTFVKDSPSKFLRLNYTQRHKNWKATCYGMVKLNTVYESYNELRSDICKITKDAYSNVESRDEDWLLPYNVPPKWKSNDTKDFDNLTLL